MNAQKKKTYFAVMLLCGLALLVDRFVLPQAALSDVPASALAQLARPGEFLAASTSLVQPNATIPAVSFPRGLPHADLGADLSDWFAIPGQRPSGPDNADPKSSAGNEARPSRNTFASKNRLHAVLWSEGLRIAVLNEQWAREGEEIGGCRLIEILDNEVRIECPDGVIGLSIGMSVPHIRD